MLACPLWSRRTGHICTIYLGPCSFQSADTYHKLTFCLTTDFNGAEKLLSPALQVCCGNTTAVFVVTLVWPSLLQHQPDKTVTQLQRGHKAAIVLTMTAPRLWLYLLWECAVSDRQPPVQLMKAAFLGCIILSCAPVNLTLLSLEQQVIIPPPPTPTQPHTLGVEDTKPFRLVLSMLHVCTVLKTPDWHVSLNTSPV